MIDRLSKLERNNVDQAMAYYQHCREAGTWTPDKARTVLHMQDNPDALIAALVAAGEAE